MFLRFKVLKMELESIKLRLFKKNLIIKNMINVIMLSNHFTKSTKNVAICILIYRSSVFPNKSTKYYMPGT